MSRAKSRFAIAAVVLSLGAWWLWPSSSCKNSVAPAGGDFDIMADRVWIDHIPTTERDKIDVFVIFADPTFGVFTTSSAYEGDWAAFEWQLNKGLELTMLQADTKHKVHPKIMSGAACAPFDYCMKLKGAPRGSKRYGSMEDWVINSQSDFDVRETISELVASEAAK